MARVTAFIFDSIFAELKGRQTALQFMHSRSEHPDLPRSSLSLSSAHPTRRSRTSSWPLHEHDCTHGASSPIHGPITQHNRSRGSRARPILPALRSCVQATLPLAKPSSASECLVFQGSHAPRLRGRGSSHRRSTLSGPTRAGDAGTARIGGRLVHASVHMYGAA